MRAIGVRQLPHTLDRARRSKYAVSVRLSSSELIRVPISVGSVSLLLILSACEVSTTARIHQGPTFSLDGSGHLVSFNIYGPQPGHKIATPNDSKSLVWSINLATGDHGELVSRMEVVYRKVPKGYVQTTPSSGTAPLLSSGLVYHFFAETTGAPGAEGFFYMDQTTPITISVPGLCPSGFVGDVKPLKCGTQEPYSEPQDIESFVKEHCLD